MLRNAFVFLFLGLLAGSPLQATPELQDVVKDLGLVPQVKVEVQGSVAGYSSEISGLLYDMIRSALVKAREVAPNGSVTLFSPDPSGRAFQHRQFLLILTDVNVVKVGRAKASVGDLDAGSLVSISQGAPQVETLILFLRVDRLALQDKKSFLTYAYHRIFAALARELFGVWTEHLSLDVAALNKKMSSNGNGFEADVAIRTWREYQRLLLHPQLANADYYGPLFSGFLQASDQVSQNSGELLGPYVIPHLQNWSLSAKARLKPNADDGMNIWMRAQHLVYAVRPSDRPRSIFSLEASSNSVLQRKALFISLVDTRDKDRRSLGLPAKLDTEELPFGPSETLLSTLPEMGLDQVLQVVLWTDRIFYTADGKTHPDALALATTAWASEMYQAVQYYLFQPAASKVVSNGQRLAERRVETLERAVSFVDSLRQSRYWNELAEQERQSFDRVQETYRSQANGAKCVVQVLRKSDSN